MSADASHGVLGRPQPRIDGRAKVTGRAVYASDQAVARPAYAYLLTSAIARGRILRIDAAAARAVAGVLDVLTGAIAASEGARPPPPAQGGGATALGDERIHHDGQIIGVVVAETYEIAREAARLVAVDYAAEAPAAGFDSPGAEERVREQGEHHDYQVGEAEAALVQGEVRIDAWYETPTQHHNPIELFTTTCAWDDGRLTIWEPSQFVYGLRSGVAEQLGMDPEQVRVVSRYVGGAFGSRGAATARTAWIAVAARRLGRPVKLAATREQGFTIATYRAETRHHLQLAASRDGRLQALRHESWELTSRPSNYSVSGTETTARMYACRNILTKVNIVRADRSTPGFMRAPPETPYMFALECAMDELAFALGLDPIELRRRNDTPTDPVSGLPYAGRRLIDAFEQGAERFGWARRDPRPGSMREGDWQRGLGCAAAAYPANIAVAAARVRLDPDGRARVQIAGHDIGTGAYTVVAMVAAEKLGLAPADIEVSMGDSALPPASLAAGSSHTATIAHAVARACDELAAKIAAGSAARPLEAYAENIPDGLPPEAMEQLRRGQLPILRGHGRKDVSAYAFGAQFAEVRVHRRTGEIRVARLLGAFAAGRILNPLTAYSQLMGGMIWGIGAALLEKTELDRRAARYLNADLAEYQVPVQADVGEVQVLMLPEDDSRANPMGIKGIGEIGIVGVNAAIANAVHHATGRRIRRLPIRLEDLL